MFDQYKSQLPDIDPSETEEWLESLESLINVDGPQRAAYILRAVLSRARDLNVGVPPSFRRRTSIRFPLKKNRISGDEMMEKRIRRIIRWNAMAMVQRANKRFPGIGGHISTYASSASLYEVGFNHFSADPIQALAATNSLSRDTPRRASTHGRFSKVD